MLTAAFKDLHIKNSKNHKKVILFSSTLTHSQSDAGIIELGAAVHQLSCVQRKKTPTKTIESVRHYRADSKVKVKGPYPSRA